MLILYFRMFFQMCVYLYTSRIVLDKLGIVDYGIFDAVSGIVMTLSMVNNALATGTLRYTTFAIGKEDTYYLNQVYSISVNIHILLAFIIVFLGEPLGLWYVQNRMQYPPELYDSVFWVFQCAMANVFITIASVPYNMLIIAHERMSTFAGITLIDVILKLCIALSLDFYSGNRLEIYATALVVVSLIVRAIYAWYCSTAFKTVRYKWVKETSLYKEMLSFTGWSAFGNIPFVLNNQGMSVLVNWIGGPLVGPIYNSAKSISTQAQNALSSFITAFQTSINPQITKTYAQHQLQDTHKLVFTSARISFSLALIAVIPLLLETPFFLGLWLVHVPPYTITFTRILIIVALIDTLSNPLLIAAEATGKIKRFQLLTNIPMICTIPLAYLLEQSTGRIEFVFVTLALTTAIAFCVRLYMSKGLYHLSTSHFFKEVIVRIVLLTIVSISLPIVLKYTLPHSILLCSINVLASIIWTTIAIYTFVLTSREKTIARQKLSNLWRR